MPDPSLTSNFLVYSQSHALVPFAWRLKHEGVDVDLLIFTDQFKRSWDGLLEKRPGPKSKDPHKWKDLIEQAGNDDLIIITDNSRAGEMFSGAPRLYGRLETTGGTQATNGGERLYPKLYLGAWWNGEKFLHHHWLFPDWGAWTGGQGPAVLGGLTMYVPDSGTDTSPLPDVMEPLAEQLGSFKGLVRVGLLYDVITKGWKTVSVEAGWPWLHSHAFVWDIPLSSLLMGLSVEWKPHRFTTVVPISMPPWPGKERFPKLNIRPDPVPVPTVNQMVRSQMFFHDFQRRDKDVWTAGIDRLFGVSIGAGQTLTKARGMALAIATGIQLPEKQFRSDAAAEVELMLVGLEDLGFL